MTAVLSDLTPGQSATISGFREHGPVAQRMMSFGVLPGTDVRVIRLAPAGDPMQIELLGYSLSLRRSEAVLVTVEDIR
jgi:ferrous iron transport protein A